MSRRARVIWLLAGGAAALLVALLVSSVLVLRSDWFSNQVRLRVIAEIEKASGGRAEIGAFHFDWHLLRARVDGFVLHGTEPPDRPPLVRADSIEVGIKVISAIERSVDIRYVDVRRPQVALIIKADGSTNIPAPKASHKNKTKGTLDTILEMAIGRFSLQDGTVAVEGRGRTPFDASGRNLNVQFGYDSGEPRYSGDLAVDSAALHWGILRTPPLSAKLAVAFEKNRLQVHSGSIQTAQSRADFSGSIDSLTTLSGSFQGKARVGLAEATRMLDWRIQLDGPLTLEGSVWFEGASGYRASGSFHTAGARFRPDPHYSMRDFHAEGSVNLTPARLNVSGMRFGGIATSYLTGAGRNAYTFPVSGQIGTVTLRRAALEAAGVRVEALDGSFTGKTTIAGLERVRIEGDANGFDARQMLLLYNGQTVPWDAAASGPVELAVSLGHASTFQIAGHLKLTPSGTGAPVDGSIQAHYDASSETLDLGDSYLALPATRARFSGVLGRKLRVHADSRNLNEVLPAFAIESLPVRLENGEAKFDGEIDGTLDDPHIVGHAVAQNLVWSKRTFTSLAGDVDVSPGGISVHNGSVQQGALSAQGSLRLAMRDWTVESSSQLAAAGSIRNAAFAELLALADVRDAPLAGTVDAQGAMSGTVGDPRIDASFAVTHGTIAGEPFDRFTGSLAYTGGTVDVANARLAAGARQATFKANYQHQPGTFEKGRLQFQVDTNVMPIDQFQAVARQAAGLRGTLEGHAAGAVDIAPAKSGPGFRIVKLDGTLAARDLKAGDESLHDANLTIETKASQIVAHLDSNLGGSVIHGEGQWNLAGDYPGSAEIRFQRVDLARLPRWLGRGTPPGGVQLTGSAEGALSITGPAADPALWKAALRIDSLQVGPGKQLAANGDVFALHNSGAIVLAMERDVIQVQSARLVGRATDLSLAGSVNVHEKNALNLRVSGSFDLASLQDFNHDIYAEGKIDTSTTIRGPLNQPQVNGRLEFKDATFNLTELPIGIYKTNGVIAFDGSRATIQSFTGESGGGTISLSGFAGYTGPALVFRLHANTRNVRVRYPQDFSTIADASLSLTGTSESSMLSGRISVLRTGFNPHSDFSSILASSAEPVRTPSVDTGVLGNMHFDVQIDTAPNLTFESTLAQGIQAEASLHLRGTVTNPSLLGRISMTQGKIVFFGTQFNLNQGAIAFYNPVKIEPVFDVDLETKERGIDVILNISGPINKLSLTPRSDPPLPFSDVLALLATGRSPTSDYSTLMASPATAQSLQQLGASSLLGQAIASPVTGRLQRFFGVTRLKIDPGLTGVTGAEYNPQARLTIEQQVTPEVTFTYITDVTSTNPLVVQVEWAFSREWSAVALRDENGLFGLNFFYKKRFK